MGFHLETPDRRHQLALAVPAVEFVLSTLEEAGYRVDQEVDRTYTGVDRTRQRKPKKTSLRKALQTQDGWWIRPEESRKISEALKSWTAQPAEVGAPSDLQVAPDPAPGEPPVPLPGKPSLSLEHQDILRKFQEFAHASSTRGGIYVY